MQRTQRIRRTTERRTAEDDEDNGVGDAEDAEKDQTPAKGALNSEVNEDDWDDYSEDVVKDDARDNENHKTRRSHSG